MTAAKDNMADSYTREAIKQAKESSKKRAKIYTCVMWLNLLIITFVELMFALSITKLHYRLNEKDILLTVSYSL